MSANSEATQGPSGLKAFIKISDSLADEPRVFYWQGLMYRKVDLREANDAYPPTGGAGLSNLLFKVAGFNIARAYCDPAIPTRDGKGTAPGYYHMTRELMFCLDPITGELVDTWENPYIPVNPDGSGGTITKTVQVMHVANDPVSAALYESDFVGFENRLFPVRDDKLGMEGDVFLRYPSVLAGDPKYARFSANDTYQTIEMTRYLIDKKQFLDPSLNTVPDVVINWSRISQYLPWMHMGRAPGGIVTNTIGYKVPGGFEGLPEWMKKVVHERYPRYTEPPAGPFPRPNVNETSWTYFKKELDSGRYSPAQIP